MKKNIKIDGIISHRDNSEMTETEMENFLSLFIEIVESNGAIFGGGVRLLTDKEVEEEEDRILEDQKTVDFMNDLEAAGVDNWDGYDIAQEMRDEREGTEED